MNSAILDPTANTNGTSLQGYTEMTIGEAKALLGPPHRTFGDFFDGKITNQWLFRVHVAGEVFVATLYDYKRSETLHIGGSSRKVLIGMANALRAAGYTGAVRDWRSDGAQY